MLWILLVLYTLLFMFNMGLEFYTQFYKIRYRDKSLAVDEVLTCFLFSVTPLLNLFATFLLICDLITVLSGRSVEQWIEKLCRIGLK